VNSDEPHAARRKEILKKYPQIKELFGYDSSQAYMALFWITTQAILAVYLHDKPWLLLLLVAYCYGGFAGHALYLAMHELSHNLFFPKNWQNKAFGIFANLFTIFPHFS
jgi:sphingolipid delta-4 desaturase